MEHHAHSHHAHDPTQVGPLPTDETVKDPVCGMDVSPATAKAHHDWDGRTWHFCSARCAEKFRADPTRYAEPWATPVEPPAGVAAEAVEYTCPMHPEIVRPAPGSCPICGMALEPRVPTATEGASDDRDRGSER